MLPLTPEDAYRATCRGITLERQGRVVEAGLVYRQVVARLPDFELARVMNAQNLLLQGRWDEGWREFEWRLRAFDYQDISGGRVPMWQGQSLAGKAVMVVTDMGAGDQVMTARYLPALALAGVPAVFVVLPRMRRLFAHLEGPLTMVRCPDEGIPRVDFQIRMLSLPFAFATTPETVPPPGILKPDPGLVAFWGERLKQAGAGLKIGLSWRGNACHPRDSDRSLSLDALAPLLALPGVRFFGLSMGEEAQAEVGALSASLPFTDLSKERKAPNDDFVDTTAIIANLDLVITVDTSCAHFGGDLGIPTWVLLATTPDWRWLLVRHDSPWYPSVRLFRQPKPGDWQPVVAELADALAHWKSPGG